MSWNLRENAHSVKSLSFDKCIPSRKPNPFGEENHNPRKFPNIRSQLICALNPSPCTWKLFWFFSPIQVIFTCFRISCKRNNSVYFLYKFSFTYHVFEIHLMSCVYSKFFSYKLLSIIPFYNYITVLYLLCWHIFYF